MHEKKKNSSHYIHNTTGTVTKEAFYEAESLDMSLVKR
jgi:hypothetical protein